MRNLEIDSSTNLAHILSELKSTEEDGLELTSVPGQQSLLENRINKKIIEKFASAQKKEVVFPAVLIDQAPEVEPDDMGFVEGEDVVAKAPIEDVHQMLKPAAVVVAAKQTGGSNSGLIYKIYKSKFFWPGAIVLAILSLLGVGLFVLPSAEVVITAKTTDKESQLTLKGSSLAKEASLKDSVVPYESTEVTKEGADEQATTGKKTIGTVSKGRVTITNQDDTTAKTFVAGTILTPTTNANITFKLDSDVAIEQAPTGGEKTAGVNVTAVKAGEESNLAEGTTFKVGSSPTALVFAKNDVAFSGGSSKLANVASAEDRENLKKKIIDKLEEEAKAEIEKKQKDAMVVEDSFEVTVTSETYDPKAVDAESDKLKATITINAKAAFVSEEQVKKLITESLSKGQEGFSVDPENIEVTLTQTDKSPSGEITMIAKVNAKLVPELDTAEIKRNLAGKSISEAGAYLDNLDEVSAYKVSVSPFYLRLLGRVPFFADKIVIKID